MPKVSYVAYIDESGDDGLVKVSPRDPNGASEWFVLSALVVRAETQRETVWVRDALARLKLPQRKDLHFQPLDPERKLKTCMTLADLPVRCFTVVSNKQNMRGHQNVNAAKVYAPARNWFYWWMTRLLLERVTDFCERRSLRDYGEPRLVRLEFSRRGGLFYSHFRGYLMWLQQQSKNDALFLKKGDLKWSVMDPMNQVFAYEHGERAGLQLADVVAGAFFQAVNLNRGVCDPRYAKALSPRMAVSAAGNAFDYSVKLMPGNYLFRAQGPQREIFDFYRDEKKWRAPGS